MIINLICNNFIHWFTTGVRNVLSFNFSYPIPRRAPRISSDRDDWRIFFGGGVEIFQFWVFGYRKIFIFAIKLPPQNFLRVAWFKSRDFFGLFKTTWRFGLRSSSGNFCGSEIEHGIVLKLNFGPGIFLGFDFCPHSIVPVTWNLEYPRPPALWDPITKLFSKFLTCSWIHCMMSSSEYAHESWYINFVFKFLLKSGKT